MTSTVSPLRAAADTVAAMLGVNTWVSFVLVPGLLVGAFARQPALWAMAPIPLIFLAVGVLRRSPMWLLLVYPASLLLPVAIDPRVAGDGNAGRVPLLISTFSLVGFLFGAAYLSSYAATQPPAARRTLKRSLAAAQPARWRRRRRIYIVLTAFSALFPAALLYRAALDPQSRAFFLELYPGDRGPAMIALTLAGILALWLTLWNHAVIGPLRRHRTGDKELVAELDRLRQDARKGSPHASFYVAVVIALVLMAVLLVTRLG